uniref:Putative gag-polypeptide of LTR copia-type n=1 Tax=Helianthus annuus TaxID=4232 RepID=A0A251U3E8_HELAN
MSTVIQVTANNNFPIRLTANNFPSWRKQIQSSLIGLDLDAYIDGTKKPPAKFLDAENTKPNPDYNLWFRQDQTILSAILGSCSDAIQPLISSADTSKDAWERLITSFANKS